MISGRYTVHSSERIKSPARNAKTRCHSPRLCKTLSQEFSSRSSFRNYGGGKRRRRTVGILREDVSYRGLMNAWSEGIFQNHCARAISRAKVRIILRFKNINCHQAAAPPWWIHGGKAAYRATSFSLNTLASASRGSLENLADHKSSLQHRLWNLAPYFEREDEHFLTECIAQTRNFYIAQN